MIKNLFGAVAALSLAVAPSMASAATANPAASLSISKSMRTGSATSNNSQLHGGGSGFFFAILIVAGVIAIGVIAATKDDNVNTPVSR